MKKSQKETMAMEAEREPGTPHIQMSRPTRSARTALRATMMRMNFLTAPWMRFTTCERRRMGVLNVEIYDDEYTPTQLHYNQRTETKPDATRGAPSFVVLCFIRSPFRYQ